MNTSPSTRMLRTPRIESTLASSYYYQAYHSITAAPQYTPPGSLRSVLSNETLLEVIDSVDGKRQPGMHPCSHYKRTWSGQPASLTSWPSSYTDGGTWTGGKHSEQYVWNNALGPNLSTPANGPSRFGKYEKPDTGLPVLASYSAELGLVIPNPPGLDELINRAFYAMVPGIRPAKGLSLLNSLYELKDFTSLPRTIANFRKLPKLIGLATKFPGKALREIARIASDAYLQKEFNIMPLLSDIVGVRTALSDVRQQLNNLLKYANKPMRRHYQCNLVGYPAINESYSSGMVALYVPTTWTSTRTVGYSSSRFNATLEYSYSLPSWVNEDSLIAALLDRTGVNFNPSIIWNAIPWTFVVDWVLDVSQWLDQFKRRIIEPVVVIRGACCSFHIERSINASVKGAGQANSVTNEEVYRRFNIGNLQYLLEASGLSSKEFMLGGALILSRRRNRPT